MKTWLQWLAGEDPSSRLLATSADRTNVSLSSPNPLSLSRWLSVFIWLGLLARVVRYYLCFPLWDDESFLCVNLINRSYAELLQPLDYHQVAPVLFLWVERSVVRLFGFSEYVLRLFPFVCSIVSLFLFRRVATQLLTGLAPLFAVAIFAVSYPGIRYAAEAKQYCTDMFVSLLMLWLVVKWQQRRGTLILGLLAALMPIALGLSYPAVFAAGGLSLVIGGILVRQRGTIPEWTVWSVWNVTLVASFAIWFHMVGTVQSGAESEFMGNYWKLNFPPVAEPWRVPFWMLETHASDFLAYPMGGPKWASSMTLILCLAGLWQLLRKRQLFFLGLVLVPASLHLLAAALQKYPYGGHVKFSQYLAPMICCLAAVGIDQLIDWRAKWGYSLRTSFTWASGILVLVGSGSIIRDLANPYKTRSDFRARAFAQSFWVGVHSAEEVACMKGDLGLDFVPDQHRELSWSAHYLCNRAIEVSRSSLRPADAYRVSAARPLRCVMYRDGRYKLEQARLDYWLKGMKQYYEFIAHESIPFPRFAKDDRRLVTMEYIDSYKFVPRADLSNGLPPLVDDRKTPHKKNEDL